jgi:polyisoprenyl-teichoic acid--peptidoglycan teichoic acid transferase
MSAFLQRKWVRVALPLVALIAGILVGWLALGWGLFPVQWTGAWALDLAPAAREKYLDVVAESYTLNKDAVLAEQRLATFPPQQQSALLQDVEMRVANRLSRTENILVLGQDQRPDWESWRTDSMIVVAIDREYGQVGIISIPRDLWVNIPGYPEGQQRINAVDYIGEKMEYPGGGPALAAHVVSETLGIPTQHYVRVHLNGLVKLVDALGGVKVMLDCPLYEATPKDAEMKEYVPWSLPAGESWLDGDSARKFVTYRSVTTDFGRSQRQQQMIWALRNRALEVNLLPRLPELLAAMSNLYATDLTLIDIARLAQFGADLGPSDVHGFQIGMSMLSETVTDSGEWVLTLSDPAALAAEKEKLFLHRPLEKLGKNESGKECPPPPSQ